MAGGSTAVAPQPRESDPASLAGYLLSFDWPMRDEAVTQRLVEGGLPLWMQILDLLPKRQERGKLLELGSPPFHITLLTQKLRNYEMTLTGAVVDGRPRLQQRVTSELYNESYTFDCACFDLERDPFPFPDDEFDVVMWCEVIEHLVENPVLTLSEIHRVLKPGGMLVLSTPNVASIEHLLRLAVGGNIYNPYHLGAGLRGTRHSREYALHELRHLIAGCGFRIDVAEGRSFGLDIARMLVEEAPPTERSRFTYSALKLREWLLRLFPGEHADHLFARAAKDGPFRWCFPQDIFDQGHLAWHLRVRDPEVVMGHNDVPHTGPGWGPLETAVDGKTQRRAGPVASAFLVADGPCRSVVIELAGADSASKAEVQVWQGEGDGARWLATGHLEAPAGRWSLLEIPVGADARPAEPIHLRILAPSGVYVHRMAVRC
jgi:SAM-dependent methyltransferase